MADKKPFDTDALQQGIESLFGRAVDAFSKGREEILKQSRIGKVKLVDLTQLRRERARLIARLGEEAYRGLQADALERDDLERTYQRIVSMDERIGAKEAEIEKLSREAQAGTAAGPSSSSAKAGPKPKTGTSSKKKKKKPTRRKDSNE